MAQYRINKKGERVLDHQTQARDFQEGALADDAPEEMPKRITSRSNGSSTNKRSGDKT